MSESGEETGRSPERVGAHTAFHPGILAGPVVATVMVVITSGKSGRGISA
jgi:hypothetical protein